VKFIVEYPVVSAPGAGWLEPASITRFARAVEEAGLDGIGFTDHPAPSLKWLNGGGHETFDPFVALGFCAAVTTRIRLLTWLSVVPYRNPFLAATSMTTVDLVSGGRATFALGSGYLRSEFAALGVDFAERNDLFEESVRVMKATWTGDEVSFEGRRFEAIGQVGRPRPVQRVLCAASVTEDVPRWRRGSGLGWVTAEYAMLPRATNSRNDRESVKGRLGGRTHEISRLIGRSLRASVDYKALGENTIVIDCDVLQADGGTRTAAVTGGYVALAEAVAWLKNRKRTKGDPLLTSVSAVSVGIVDGEPRLDLCYEEDVAAQTDMNVVCTASGDFVEIQGTAEREPFSRDLLGQLLDLAVAGCGELTRRQDAALALSPGRQWPQPSRM